MKTFMHFLVSIGMALLMSACTPLTPNVNTGLKNACLPEAMIMQSALGRENIKSKVMIMRYTVASRHVGHVVVIFCYGKQMAAWDSQLGSLPIGPAESYKCNASTLGELYLGTKYGILHPSLEFASLIDTTHPGGRYAGY